MIKVRYKKKHNNYDFEIGKTYEGIIYSKGWIMIKQQLYRMNCFEILKSDVDQVKKLVTDDPKNNVEMVNNAVGVDANGNVFLRGVYEDKDLIEYCNEICREKCYKGSTEKYRDPLCLECDCPIANLYVLATGMSEIRERLRICENE